MLGQQNSPRNVLGCALQARKVAVIGASANPLKMGYSVAWDLLSHGYSGEVALINPRGGEILGRQIQTDMEAARGADLAMLMMAAERTPEAVEACGAVGIPVAVVCAGGFREKGNNDLQRHLVFAAKRAGVRLIGPNTVGPHVAPTDLRLSMIPHEAMGDVSVVSQSGGVGLLVGPRLAALGTGIDVHIPLGNKCDLGFAESVRALAERPTTRSILLYMEGGDEGDALLDAIAEVVTKIPVIAVIGGRTAAAARATRSHTGSLLTSWARLVGCLEDAGAFVAQTLSEACAATLARRSKRSARSSRVLILCDGGGQSVALAEAFENAGFDLPLPEGDHARALAELIGRPADNPCDFAGAVDGDYPRYAKAAEDAVKFGNYEAIVLGAIWGVYGKCFGDTWGRSEMEGVKLIGELAHRADVPLVAVTPYASQKLETLPVFRAAGVPVVEWPEEAAAVVAASLGRRPRRRPVSGHGDDSPAIDLTIGPMTDRILDRLGSLGLADGIGRLVDRSSVDSIGNGVWVLRLDGLVHKARAGAIHVGVDAHNLGDAYNKLTEVARAHELPTRIRLTPLIPHDHELLVSFWRDKETGLGCAIGAGGGRVEEMKDVAIGRWPATANDVERMLERTTAGSRVLAAGDNALGSTVRAILLLRDVFARDLPEAVELEVNPLAIGQTGAAVLDVLVTPGPGPAS